jgi:hypothetical protein
MTDATSRRVWRLWCRLVGHDWRDISTLNLSLLGAPGRRCHRCHLVDYEIGMSA